MTEIDHSEQKARIRDQFTRTAEVFGNFAVATRGGEADWLAKALRVGRSDRAVDVACGPGTIALRIAPQVRWVCGVDLTPAILSRAKESAAKEGLANVGFAIADAGQLPFSEASLDIALTSYSLHHMPDAGQVIAEMARVLRSGGRAGVIDIRVEEDEAVGELNTRIERIRDASHTRTLRESEFNRFFARNGLRVIATETRDHPRQFDHWLHVAGLHHGDARYAEARKLMESTVGNDAAGYHPRYEAATPGAEKELMITNNVLFIAGEKE